MICPSACRLEYERILITLRRRYDCNYSTPAKALSCSVSTRSKALKQITSTCGSYKAGETYETELDTFGMRYTYLTYGFAQKDASFC